MLQIRRQLRLSLCTHWSRLQCQNRLFMRIRIGKKSRIGGGGRFIRDSVWHQDQFVLIIPSKQLVAVRLGCLPEEKYFDEVQFFKEIAAAF